GDVLRPGIVYTAVPGQHLLVEPDGTLSFSNSEKVNFTRPSADVLFRSLAAHYKTRAIAVVLTGTGTDGALGVRAIKKYGGTVIVQDPAACAYRHMPEAAIATQKADAVLSVAEIVDELVNQLMLDQFG
ncbi:chemotaxis protein CheB, partial [Leptolyngbya sp. FACHB-36]|uniref:chemotaxis protein CheB n=1 Tax=Leptolyngbya sp. FACHB-36 TaxID=2692808 RepID=UPI00168122BD